MDRYHAMGDCAGECRRQVTMLTSVLRDGVIGRDTRGAVQEVMRALNTMAERLDKLATKRKVEGVELCAGTVRFGQERKPDLYIQE